MKLHISLKALLLFWWCTACCDDYPMENYCDQLFIEVTIMDTAHFPDSIVITDPFQTIFRKSWYPVIDSSQLPFQDYIHLSYNPTLESSTFLFYSSIRPVDTISVQHDFEINYSKCGNYRYDLKSAEVLVNTLDRTTQKPGTCLSLSAHF